MVGDCLTGLISESQRGMPVSKENKGFAVQVILFLCSLEQADAQYQLVHTVGDLMYLNKGGTRSKHHLIINKKDRLCSDLRAES